MAYVKVGGRFIHYKSPRSIGSAKGRVILLVHGAYDTHAVWQNVYGHFRREHTPIAIDLPGRGASDGPAIESAEAYAKFLDQLVRALKLKDFIFWGHSMGGSMAVDFAARQKNRVKGVIAMSASPDWKIPKKEITQWRRDPDGAFRRNLGHLFSKKTPLGVVESYDRMLRTVPPRTCQADIAACATFRGESKLKRIKAPVLVVAGDDEAWIEGSRRLRDGIKGAQFALIPGAGHAVALEQPQALCAAVEAFFARLE